MHTVEQLFPIIVGVPIAIFSLLSGFVLEFRRIERERKTQRERQEPLPSSPLPFSYGKTETENDRFERERMQRERMIEAARKRFEETGEREIVFTRWNSGEWDNVKTIPAGSTIDFS